MPKGLLAAVTQRINLQPAGMSWLARTLGNPTMKKLAISSTTLAALAACTMLIFPRAASASTPAELFKKMRSSIARAAKNGEIKLTVVADMAGSLTVTGGMDGSPLPSSFPISSDRLIVV